MSEKDDKDKKSSAYEFKYKKDYESDKEVHDNYIADFDAYEAMLIGQVYDSVSKSVDGSKITDSYAATLSKERADRVVAKLPEGNYQPMGKADVGKAAFMDILFQKYIFPNANSQHSLLEKFNMWQLYSSVYGYMPMFYDWNVSNTGYVGPDCWLWNPRNLIPQQGRTSIADMDYVTALTWVGKKYLEDLIDDIENNENDDEDTSGWDLEALKELVENCDEKSDSDATRDTLTARNRTPKSVNRGICLATRYEAGEDGEWITFAPENSNIQIRKLKNPHKNGKIPFVIKYSQPLFDSFYGLGDFQRAKPLQFARDGLTNFYFASLKRNLAPGIIVNGNGVLKHTLDVTSANPILVETIPNSIRPMPTNTAGLSTYQGAQSNLTGSLLSLYGSQNASIPGAESLNPSQGKTPQAINLYSDKEATRDGSERRHLIASIQELMDGWASLVVNVGSEDIPIELFEEDIKAIEKAGMTDVMDLFNKIEPDASGAAGTLRINPESLKGVEYRFQMNPDSTAKTNKDAQLQALRGFIDDMGKFQNMFKDDPRYDIHPEKIAQAFASLADVQGADEFVTVNPDAPSPQEQQAQMEQMKQQAAAQPSPTSVQTPGGNVHEAADLTKLYLGTTDETLKKQIVEALGFQPGESTQEPTIAANGQAYTDPLIAQAASTLHKM